MISASRNESERPIRRVAVLLINFNLSQMTDELVEQINRNTSFPHELFLLDNGSETGEVSKYTTHRVEKNLGLMGGLEFLWLAVRDRSEFDAYWFLCNDLVFDEGRDYLDEMSALHAELSKITRVGAITPSYHSDPDSPVPPYMESDGSDGWRGLVYLEWNAVLVTRELMQDLFWVGFGAVSEHAQQDVVLSFEAWRNGYSVIVMDGLSLVHLGNETFLQQGGKVLNGVEVPDYAGLEAMLRRDLIAVREDYAKRGVDLSTTRYEIHRDIDQRKRWQRYFDGYQPPPLRIRLAAGRARVRAAVHAIDRRLR